MKKLITTALITAALSSGVGIAQADGCDDKPSCGGGPGMHLKFGYRCPGGTFGPLGMFHVDAEPRQCPPEGRDPAVQHG